MSLDFPTASGAIPCYTDPAYRRRCHDVSSRSNHPPQRRKGSRMKVTQVTTRILRTPADNPLVVGLPLGNDTREFVTVEIGTDEGIEGIGLTFFGGPLTGALKAAVDALGQL